MSLVHVLLVSEAAYIPYVPLVPQRERRELPRASRRDRNPLDPRQLRWPVQCFIILYGIKQGLNQDFCSEEYQALGLKCQG